jgi:hypothetical protein
MGKKNTTIILFLGIIGIMIISQSFTGASNYLLNEDPTKCGTTVISKPNGKKSHFFGLNCSACHGDDKKGKGCFTIAGSVLNEERSNIYKNPIIKLYTEPKGGGKLVATILGDALGNFYTTENIDFSKGLYPTLIGSPNAAEPIKHMTLPIYSDMGQCNKCHGYRKDEEALGID